MRKSKIKDEDFAKMKKVFNVRDKHIDKSIYFYLSYNLRIIVMFIGIIIIAIMSYDFYNSSFQKSTDNSLAYEEYGSIDYNVKLLEDNLFEVGALIPNDSYISEIIDDISTDLNYIYKIEKNSNISYTYYVEALMELKNSFNGNIVSKNQFNLIDLVENKIENTQELNIKQNVNLDYDYYNNLALAMINKYGENIIGSLKIKMFITIVIDNEEFKNPVISNQEMIVNIPLATNEVVISMENNIDNKGVHKEESSPILVNKLSLYLSIILLVIDTIFILIVLSFILRTIPRKSKYNQVLRRILNKYDKKIVNCKELPHFEDYKILNCSSFKELVDAAIILDKPILYNEIVRNQKCVFIILSENNLYRYVLKSCDIDL